MPFLIYLSFVKPFRYEALLPLILLVFYPWIRKEPGFFIISGLVLFFVFMSYLQLSTPSIMIGFLFASIISTKVRSISDYELFVYGLVWFFLLSLFAGPFALYFLIGAGILFCWTYKRYTAIVVIILLVMIPVSLENWKWWEQIGPQGKTGQMILPRYLIQVDLPRIEGEGDEGAGSLSVSNQPLIPHYFLHPDGALHILFFLLNGIFLLLALRLLWLMKKKKKAMLRSKVLRLTIVLACIALLISGLTIHRFPVVSVVWEKGEFFKFAPRYSNAVVHPPPKEYPEYYFSFKPLLWNMDTEGKFLGILDLLGLISTFSYLLMKRIHIKTYETIEKKLVSPVTSKILKRKPAAILSGSELLVAMYNHFRTLYERDQELTPLEFQQKYPSLALQEITSEYINTEYGMKQSNFPDEKIRSLLKNLSIANP